MKIGGLTWWRNNYGSILQAYAMQETLNGYEKIDYEIICQYGKKIASVDNFMDKLKKKGLKNTVKRIFWKFGIPGLKRRNSKIQKFVDANLRISKKQYTEETIAEANQSYDGFLCGSDQIWNTALVPVDSMYWLGFANEKKLKFSYAPSIGVDRVSETEAEQIRKNLASFRAVSCREESGTRLLNHVLGAKQCVTVLDPTLLVDRSVWDAVCPPRKYQEPYIFAYMLRGNRKQRKLIEAFAREKGLKLVTMPFLDTEKIVPYDMKFGDLKYWDAGPDGFISAIRYAEYVFTDSFHCMVFSCLYHREFYAFPKLGKAQFNRMAGLLELLETGNRILREESLPEIETMGKIDWDRVDHILERERESSKNYLEKALF